MGALDGIRVLDLAGESAAFGARILADLGAEVLRLGPTDGGRLRRRASLLGGLRDLPKRSQPITLEPMEFQHDRREGGAPTA